MINGRIKIDLFCCSNSFNPDELRLRNGNNGDEMKIIPLPCSGKVDMLYLIKAFETGADGVAVITCRPGECHYLEGNLRARKRVEAVDTLMEEISIGRGRTAIIQMGDGGLEGVLHELNDFRTRIEAAPRKFYAEDEAELEKE